MKLKNIILATKIAIKLTNTILRSRSYLLVCGNAKDEASLLYYGRIQSALVNGMLKDDTFATIVYHRYKNYIKEVQKIVHIKGDE